jgi:class 3 adenylate cyclase
MRTVSLPGGLLRRLTLLVVTTVPVACNLGISQEEAGHIDRWLHCVECRDNERERVSLIGARAAPRLLGYLDLPETFDTALVARYREQYSAMTSPSVSQSDFVERSLSAYRTSVQKRAAVSLGDIGAVTSLTTALDSAGSWALEDRVVRALRNGVNRTSGSLVITGISIRPNPIQVGVGASEVPRVLVRDDLRNPMTMAEAGATVFTTDPAIATVTPAGLIRGMSPGSTSFVVAAGALSAAVPIEVVTLPLVLEIVSGNYQSGIVGGALADPIEVRVSDPSGGAVGGVSLDWTVVEGGGSSMIGSTSTRTDGTNSNGWSLGLRLGMQRLRVSAFGANSVTFFAIGAGSVALTTPAPSSEIHAWVVRSGVPAREVTVDLRTGSSGGPIVARTTTDIFGRAVFNGLAAGTYWPDVPLPSFGAPPAVVVTGTNRVVTLVES